VRRFAKLCVLALGVGVLAGASSALFLWLLEIVTDTQQSTSWLLWLLPVAGLVIGLINQRSDTLTNAGTSAVLSQARRSTSALPVALAPTVLTTTLITHLFGGSAGREGTALQLSAGLTDRLIAGPLDLDPGTRSTLLRIAVAAGFGAVFGVPIAGAVFGLEVVRRKSSPRSGRSLRHRVRAGRPMGAMTILPALIASVIGDRVVIGLGISHLELPFVSGPEWSLQVATLLIIAGVMFGLAAILLAGLTRLIGHLFRILVPVAFLRPAIGALVVLVMVAVSGTRDYLGLSLGLITEAVTAGVGVAGLAFAGKIIFTAVTLGSGFRGGEVTPLFVIGATLGASIASLAGLSGTSVALFAALGMLAVFSGAARTPWAGVVMAVELFGWSLLGPAILVCALSSWVVRDHGIYVEKS
jgi:H+/Cl- antiporter ClcA